MTQAIHSCIIIGTGFSGIAMGVELKSRDIQDFLILEKAEEVGGTWRENTYPGAECDIPSALYSFSFEPYPDWEYKWSVQAQILEYLKLVTKKYDLYQHVRFQEEMSAAVWHEEKGCWEVKTKSGRTYLSRVLIPAIGQLHHPAIPNFEGEELFEGPSWHSARWDHSIDLANKTVGVVGNAASAVQFIPEIAKTAAKVVIFQRSPNWMIPKQDRAYMAWEKQILRRFPILLRWYRKFLGFRAGVWYLIMKTKGRGFMRAFGRQYCFWTMRKHIKDPQLRKKLTPDFPFGAKRILLSDTYYAALARPNVDLVTHSIQSIRPSGILTANNSMHQLDVLIYATGFIANPFLLNLHIQGRDGITIKEHWKDQHHNYLGITTHKFPNLFMMNGPNTNLGHNSVIIMFEAQAKYIAQCVDHLLKRDGKSMEVREEEVHTYYTAIQARLKQLIWSEVDKSWYKSANGHIANNYPGRTMEYKRCTKKVNFDHYYIE